MAEGSIGSAGGVEAGRSWGGGALVCWSSAALEGRGGMPRPKRALETGGGRGRDLRAPTSEMIHFPAIVEELLRGVIFVETVPARQPAWLVRVETTAFNLGRQRMTSSAVMPW